jgi:hypothetical protein
MAPSSELSEKHYLTGVLSRFFTKEKQSEKIN